MRRWIHQNLSDQEVNSHDLSLTPAETCLRLLILQVVTGVKTGRLRQGFGDAPGRRPIRSEVQGGAVRSGFRRSSSRPRICPHLDLGRLYVVHNLQNGGHGRLHAAGLVHARLGLEVARGLEFQAFVRASRDTGAELEGLFETSTEPVEEKQISGVEMVFCSDRAVKCFVNPTRTLDFQDGG